MNIYYHICNNFTGNKVFSEMMHKFAQLEPNDLHYIFVPYTNKSLKHINEFSAPNAIIEYIFVPKFLRYTPLIKTIVVLCRILVRAKTIGADLKKGNYIGYTLWSDGSICLYLNILYGIKYIIFVRATDINIFLKYGKHIRPLIKIIYKRASYTCFPSPSLQDAFNKIDYIKKIKRKNSQLLIPNALSQFWYKNIYFFDNLSIKNKKLIYVGAFNQNKNLRGIVNSCIFLRNFRKDFVLELVGGSLEELKKLLGLNSVPSWIIVKGRLNRNEILSSLRGSNILIMPSFSETLGMVYLEAISQGCFVIHSKDQGVDGFFHDTDISSAVNPNDLKNIADTIDYLFDIDFKMGPDGIYNILKPFNEKEILLKIKNTSS